MSLIDKAKEAVVAHIATACIGAVLLVIGYVAKEIFLAIAPKLSSLLPPLVVLPMLGLSILANILLLWAVWLQNRRWLQYQRQRMRIAFGIQWDEDFQAHCPACGSVLSNYGERISGGHWGWLCLKSKASPSS